MGIFFIFIFYWEIFFREKNTCREYSREEGVEKALKNSESIENKTKTKKAGVHRKKEELLHVKTH